MWRSVKPDGITINMWCDRSYIWKTSVRKFKNPFLKNSILYQIINRKDWQWWWDAIATVVAVRNPFSRIQSASVLSHSCCARDRINIYSRQLIHCSFGGAAPVQYCIAFWCVSAAAAVAAVTADAAVVAAAACAPAIIAFFSIASYGHEMKWLSVAVLTLRTVTKSSRS